MMKNVLISVLLIAGHANAGNWMAWRGESAAGVAPDASPPAKLSVETNLLWKAPLPGVGCSTPIVWGDRIFLTCSIDGNDGVMAFDWKGKEVWRHTFGKEARVRHKGAGSGSNPSALTDGKMVYVYYKSGTLAGLTTDGSEVWKKNLQKDYAADGLKWDLGTSPVFAGGNLVVALIHADQPSYILAFDRKSGKEVWKTRREFEAPEQSADAYTTPFVTEVDGVETIVTWGCDTLTGHDAKSGKELWSHRDFNPKQAGNWRAVASAVESEGVAIVPFGRGDFLAGVKLGGSGDTTGSNRLWTLKSTGSDSCTPVVRNGKCYTLNDKGPRRGTVTCVDTETGKVEWKSKLPRSAAVYYSSPLIAGDKFYAARTDGTVFCGKLTPDGLTDVVESELNETLVASPVAIGSKLLVRSHENLWCFE